MIVVNMILFFLYFILFILSKSYSSSVFSKLNKKEHPLHFFYPMSNYLIERTPLKRLFLNHKGQLEQFKALYIRNNPEEMKMLHWCKKISIILLILICSNAISFCSLVGTSKDGKLQEGRYISRPDYGEEEEEVQLDVIIEDTKRDIERKIFVRVEERQYNEEQLQKIFKQTEQYIDKNFLGKNESRDNINEPLELVKSMSGTGVKIDWDLGSEELIDSKGDLHNEKVEEPGVLIQITARIKYKKMEEEYPIFLFIKPKVREKEEQLFTDLQEIVMGKEKDSITESRVTLPEKIDNHPVHFAEDKKSKGIHLLLIGVILAVAMGYIVDRQVENKMHKRELELRMDFPEIMNKFSLLLGAGMTVKSAWERIAGEYSEKVGKEQEKRRFAYEEILLTWRELSNGVTESTAFDNFGKRVKLMPYIKFSSLLSQNLKKGSKGLLEVLELEAVDAFEERKELAKRLGEEAGTKLLGPMMLMLIIVLFLIMIPAFMTL